MKEDFGIMKFIKKKYYKENFEDKKEPEQMTEIKKKYFE